MRPAPHGADTLTLTHLLGAFVAALALIGCAYTLTAALLLHRFAARRGPVVVGKAGVTLVKPLHGAEPHLYDNLATFLAQRHGGPVQLLCGVARVDDAAAATVEALRRDHPAARIDLVVDGTVHGSNGKVSNLVNMAPFITHEIVVLSDSDMAVPVDYLARVLDALAAPGVGMATCVYRGRGDAGGWSAMVAGAIGYHFLPSVAVNLALGAAPVGMGSTIALRRDALARIGGFARFADTLADDHAMAVAVRDLGLAVTVPPMILTHGCDETSLAALWRHELRWATTVRGVASVAQYAGLVVTHPLPLALIVVPLWPAAGGVATIAALAARLALAAVADAASGARVLPRRWLPARDVLSFGVYIASFFTRSVDWRDSRLRLGAAGRIATETTRGFE